MTLAANPPTSPETSRVGPALRRLLRRRAQSRPGAPDVPAPPEALVQALCHDMRSPLASLEALLGALERQAEPAAGPAPDPGEVLELARAQTAHLASSWVTSSARRWPAPGCRPRS